MGIDIILQRQDMFFCLKIVTIDRRRAFPEGFIELDLSEDIEVMINA